MRNENETPEEAVERNIRDQEYKIDVAREDAVIDTDALGRIAGWVPGPGAPQIMETLDALSVKNKTDQGSLWHTYCDRIEPYLAPIRQSSGTFLELGIDGGAGLKMWRDYFPNAKILGLDHNRTFVDNFEKLREERIEPIFGDATDKSAWEEIRVRTGGTLLGCNDDAGHFSHQIIPAFQFGFPLIKPGGVWIVSDIHHIYKHEDINDPNKFFTFLQRQIHDMNEHGYDQCGKPTRSDIAFIHMSKSLAIIGKRQAL